MAQHRVQQWATFARMWWLYDAKWQCPFQSAPVIIRHLQGQHKPIYHPLGDVGDHVVVINTEHIAMEGDLWRTWRHFHHTGYPGGFSDTRVWKVHEADPTKVLHKQIYSTIKGNLLRRPIMARLHLYRDENVPEDILKNITGQIRQQREVPKRLDEYTQEERDAFPRLFEWPEDYVPNPGKKTVKS
ncbi:39S ribosomal protein L13, mitochondrial [Lamellibrachia satsuma]|nr:39S ribosomal protein L13, mitochondrial [Lamellibrachia satsuma]